MSQCVSGGEREESGGVGTGGGEKGMMWPLRGCRVVGGHISSLLLREGNPNSRTPFKHSPTLPRSADDPRTRALDGAEGSGTVSVGRAGVSDSLLRLFITAVLVLFPARLLVLQNT